MSKSLTLTQKSGSVLSKLQKTFNNYVQKIKQLKTEREEVSKQLEVINVRVSGELVPLERKLVDKRVAFVLLVDKHYEDKFFKKKEKEKMTNFIQEQCHELILEFGREDLKEVFEKYNNGQSFDEMDEEINKETAEAMKSMMGNMFGIDIEDDADVDSPEKMQAYLAEKMEQREAEEEARRARKKTAKQIEKEEKIREETKNISKTARAIYTDLVKEFHPDREQDEAEKVRKNSIMHQITEAYEQNDLFRLLQLKLELQATSPDALNLADEQLKYYNKILKEQVDELQGELYGMKSGSGFGMSFYQRLGGNEKTMNMKFAAEINKLKRSIKDYDHDLKLLTDRYHMRDFLKQISIQQEPDFFDLFGM